MRGLIGKKMGMTRIYDENGLIVPVTLITGWALHCYSNQNQQERWI